MNQTYKDIEIICILDGEDEICENIVKEFIHIDNRFKMIKQINSGANFSRKVGFQNSLGEYVTFVDSDDWISVYTLEKCAKSLENNDFDLVKFGYVKVNNKNKYIYFPITKAFTLIQGKQEVKNIVINNMFKNYDFNQMWGQVIKKSKIRENFFNMDLTIAEDLYFNYNLINSIDSILLIEDCCYYYYFNNNSITKTKNKVRLLGDFNDITYVYQKILEDIESDSLFQKDQLNYIYYFVYKELIFYIFRCLNVTGLSYKDKINFILKQAQTDFYLRIKQRVKYDFIRNDKNGYRLVFKEMYNNHIKKALCYAMLIEIFVKIKK